MDKDPRNIVPDQKEGASTNVEHSYSADSTDEAIVIFQDACSRLLDINHWDEVAGAGSATFILTDENGEATHRPVREGFHFKIDVPGPGSKTGDGYDWVKVEKIEIIGEQDKDQESIAIRVRPTTNPSNADPDTAHFFTSEATSNFILRREGHTVTAAVYGRNEIPNTDAERLADKTRNAVMGMGAASGISSIQWKSLVKGIIGK